MDDRRWRRRRVGYHPPDDTRRYQPGYVTYQGYCAAYEGLKFLHDIGVGNALAHSVALNCRLIDGLDATRYPCITPDPERVPFVTILIDDPYALQQSLERTRVVVSWSGRRMRVSPALYNNESDVDRPLRVLNA